MTELSKIDDGSAGGEWESGVAASSNRKYDAMMTRNTLTKLSTRRQRPPHASLTGTKYVASTQKKGETFFHADNYYDFFTPHTASTMNNNNTDYQPKIKWIDFAIILAVHMAALGGLLLVFTTARYLTTLWAFFLVYTSGFGITAGAHRLWSHRAYKAKWPLRLILIILFTITGQRDVYTWALDHRIHHKFSETDSDPHNAKRGFFFAHVGWVFTTPHPDVIHKREIVDMNDLEEDPIVMWQKRFYVPLFSVLAIGIPVGIPWYFWNEPVPVAFLIGFALRFCLTLNLAFFVNSVAHMWGNKPYDKYISSVENVAVSLAALGEGYHNYHHVFPWDYKTSELGDYTFNLSTGFIDLFAKIGWAYDRKNVSPAMIQRRALRLGDGTHVLRYEDKNIGVENSSNLNIMTNKKV